MESSNSKKNNTENNENISGSGVIDKKLLAEACQLDLHLKYLLNLDKTKDAEAIGYFTNEYLRMAGIFIIH